MALPKIQAPTFRARLESTGKDVRYRGFLVKEEKLLLVAKESNERKDLIDAFKQIVTNCVIDEVDVDSLPLFDLEYLFLMIRSKSQDNKAKVRITDEDDKQEYDGFFDFDKVTFTRDPKHSKTVDLDGKVGVVMRYPTIRDLEELGMFEEAAELKSEAVIALIKRCIESVYDADDVYPMAESTDAEREEFFDSLSSFYVERIQEFFTTLPAVVGWVEYKKDGKMVKKEIRGAANFLA
jgi:predicted DNA-binding protein YlxM (UPF0122 family)